MSTTMHFVEFNFPGAFFAKQSVHEIAEGEDFVIPDGAYSWQTFDVVEGQEHGIVFKSGRINKSPLHLMVVDGPYTAAMLRKHFPEDRILASNTEQYPRGSVKVVGGWWQPVHDDDVLVQVNA